MRIRRLIPGFLPYVTQWETVVKHFIVILLLPPVFHKSACIINTGLLIHVLHSLQAVSVSPPVESTRITFGSSSHAPHGLGRHYLQAIFLILEAPEGTLYSLKPSMIHFNPTPHNASQLGAAPCHRPDCTSSQLYAWILQPGW